MGYFSAPPCHFFLNRHNDRYDPQAYVIDVTLSDGCKYTVFRRFNEFHDVNQKLEERFPVDAGYFNYGQRTLPELPGKILFGRSAVRNVAEQRLPQLNEYLKVRRCNMLVSSSARLCHEALHDVEHSSGDVMYSHYDCDNTHTNIHNYYVFQHCVCVQTMSCWWYQYMQHMVVCIETIVV